MQRSTKKETLDELNWLGFDVSLGLWKFGLFLSPYNHLVKFRPKEHHWDSHVHAATAVFPAKARAVSATSIVSFSVLRLEKCEQRGTPSLSGRHICERAKKKKQQHDFPALWSYHIHLISLPVDPTYSELQTLRPCRCSHHKRENVIWHDPTLQVQREGSTRLVEFSSSAELEQSPTKRCSYMKRPIVSSTGGVWDFEGSEHRRIWTVSAKAPALGCAGGVRRCSRLEPDGLEIAMVSKMASDPWSHVEPISRACWLCIKSADSCR